MKIILLFIVAILACAQTGIAQNFTFGYDAAGNRTSRTIPLKSTASFNQADTAGQTLENFNEKIGDLLFTFYPNPTKDEVNLKIDNLDLNLPSNLMVFDNAGRLVIAVEKLIEFNTLDFSALPPGNYIIKIQVGDTQTDWKVIKE